MRVSEIRVKRIRVNQGLGVYLMSKSFLFLNLQDVVEAAKTVSKAKRTLAASLSNFQFDCLGTSLTDDEIIIANSLKEFARFLNEVEDEMDRFLDHAHEKFIQPLVDFRKKQIGSVKMTKKDFDKSTARYVITT